MKKITLVAFTLIFLAQSNQVMSNSGVRVHDKYLQKASTGMVVKPVLVRSYVSSENSQTYKISINGKWIEGRCSAEGLGGLHALLVDLNFDGYADILITGFTDSQGRARCSDAWLYDVTVKKYVYNSDLSAIPNLEVSVDDKLIEGGISNCGCAAQCFFYDTYKWNSAKLIKVFRREQDCEIYREFSIVDGVLTQTNEKPAQERKFLETRNQDPVFIDLLEGTEIDQKR